MHFHWTFVLLVHLMISNGKSRAIEDAVKCCGLDHILFKSENSSFRCAKDTVKRLTIFANQTNFLDTETDGQCVEVYNDQAYTFTIRNGDIAEETPLTSQIFQKCCPLGYSYHPQLHACTKTDLAEEDFITGNVVRVGLPQCKLIVDYELDDRGFWSGSDFCVDRNVEGGFVRRECREDTEICGGIRCVRKCCADGQSFVNGSNCVDTFTNGLDLTFSTSIDNPRGPFAVISNRTCKRIYRMGEKRYTFNLLEDGRFRYWQNYTESYVYEDVSSQSSYCIEHSEKAGAHGFFFFKCFPEKGVKEKFIFSRWPKIVSCIFLALTILIYVLLNETRTIFGKILMNYCVGTMFMFSLLTYSQYHIKTSNSLCKLAGYGLIFFSTASFAWLNVMCCDIWFTFGGYQCNITRSTKHSVGLYQRRRDLKKILWYTLYGWGMPTALSLIIYGFSQSIILPYAIHPYVGSTSCFIESRKGNYAATLFLRFPHCLIQIVNTVLFFKTILYCMKIKNEINRINDTTKYEKKHRFKKDKERLFLILKLSVIMGLGFIFDTISGFVVMSELGSVPKYIEIVWDCFNCLQGT
ncbi:unnamed protein product [Phaedon cochleariae]|uniref:G-protein coupled receptors family 2 profile 2 domain-containing protein n=1 Tax=Phaedon cochleariae TaxID=80249 RepID=A0A9N9SEQ6_PHACE|nr:unnamed protein product [Phaedon cochleariae]